MAVRLLRPYAGQAVNTIYVGPTNDAEQLLVATGTADDFIERASNYAAYLASLPGAGSGLTQAQVDARVNSLAPGIVASTLPSAQAGLNVYNLAPDPGGDSGPVINAAFQAGAAKGGVTINLTQGAYAVNQSIIVPANCMLIGSGKGTVLSKGTSFPAGGTLVDMSGNGSGGATGTGHNFNQGLCNISLAGGTDNGLLLNLDYTSLVYSAGVRFRGSGATAVSMRETWDSVFVDWGANSCGGTSGDADAVIRILASAADKANLLRFYGLRVESFRNCAVLVSDDGNSFNPYTITFSGLKLESNVLVTGSTMFRSTRGTYGITIRDAYCAPDAGLTTAPANVGIFDLDGFSHNVENVLVGVGSGTNAPQCDYIIRTPRGNALLGGTIKNVQVLGGSAVTCIIDNPSTTATGGSNVYSSPSMIVDNIIPFGSVPLLGGTGVNATRGTNTTNLIMRQLLGTACNTQTAGNNIVQGQMNRIIPYNSASAGTFTIPAEPVTLGFSGDVLTISQEGAGAATLAAFTGVTLQVPTGLSATTNGQYSQIRARKIATNIWRIF